MPKVMVRVLSTKIEDNKLIATIKCNQKMPKIGELAILKWGSTRTIPQNSLYWRFLNWCIEYGGLKDFGHFDAYALHLDLKAHLIAEKIFDKGKFKAIEEATTTTMDKGEFGEFIEAADKFIQDFFEISTAEFWEMHRSEYAM